jgi:hypothetical protein
MIWLQRLGYVIFIGLGIFALILILHVFDDGWFDDWPKL